MGEVQKTIKKLFRQNETYVFLILLALSFLIQVRSGQFYTSNNIVDIASAMIVPGLFAVGEFLVILSGGIDVSFPALASLTAYATTKLFLNLDYQGSVLLPMLMAIVIGAVLGMFNGFFVSFLRLPAMIVTLGTASVFKGIMQGTLESKQLAVIPAGMKAFGKQAIYCDKPRQWPVVQASGGISGVCWRFAPHVPCAALYHVRPGHLRHWRQRICSL